MRTIRTSRWSERPNPAVRSPRPTTRPAEASGGLAGRSRAPAWSSPATTPADRPRCPAGGPNRPAPDGGAGRSSSIRRWSRVRSGSRQGLRSLGPSSADLGPNGTRWSDPRPGRQAARRAAPPPRAGPPTPSGPTSGPLEGPRRGEGPIRGDHQAVATPGRQRRRVPCLRGPDPAPGPDALRDARPPTAGGGTGASPSAPSGNRRRRRCRGGSAAGPPGCRGQGLGATERQVVALGDSSGWKYRSSSSPSCCSRVFGSSGSSGGEAPGGRHLGPGEAWADRRSAEGGGTPAGAPGDARAGDGSSPARGTRGRNQGHAQAVRVLVRVVGPMTFAVLVLALVLGIAFNAWPGRRRGRGEPRSAGMVGCSSFRRRRRRRFAGGQRLQTGRLDLLPQLDTGLVLQLLAVGTGRGRWLRFLPTTTSQRNGEQPSEDRFQAGPLLLLPPPDHRRRQRRQPARRLQLRREVLEQLEVTLARQPAQQPG